MEDIMGSRLGEDYQAPKRHLNVKVAEDADELEMLTLAAGLRATISSDDVSMWNFRQMRANCIRTVGGIQAFLYLIAAFLFLLSFYQLLLSIDESLQEGKYSIGVLRAMGMKKEQVASVTVAEACANIIAATAIGFILGRIMSTLAMSVLTNLLEMPVDTRFFLEELFVLITISISTVYVGTRVSVAVLNQKKVTAILKGD